VLAPNENPPVTAGVVAIGAVPKAGAGVAILLVEGAPKTGVAADCCPKAPNVAGIEAGVPKPPRVAGDWPKWNTPGLISFFGSASVLFTCATPKLIAGAGLVSEIVCVGVEPNAGVVPKTGFGAPSKESAGGAEDAGADEGADPNSGLAGSAVPAEAGTPNIKLGTTDGGASLSFSVAVENAGFDTSKVEAGIPKLKAGFSGIAAVDPNENDGAVDSVASFFSVLAGAVDPNVNDGAATGVASFFSALAGGADPNINDVGFSTLAGAPNNKVVVSFTFSAVAGVVVEEVPNESGAASANALPELLSVDLKSSFGFSALAVDPKENWAIGVFSAPGVGVSNDLASSFVFTTGLGDPNKDLVSAGFSVAAKVTPLGLSAFISLLIINTLFS
jgi:hypothetical protein